MLNGFPFAILTHLLFAFPSGRLQRRSDRVFVGLGYLVTTVTPPIGILFFDPAVSDDCPECPGGMAVVRVERRDGLLCVEIEDDGAGGANASGGSGLRGLADRVGALDGALEVESPAGHGTTVRARLPVRS